MRFLSICLSALLLISCKEKTGGSESVSTAAIAAPAVGPVMEESGLLALIPKEAEFAFCLRGLDQLKERVENSEWFKEILKDSLEGNLKKAESLLEESDLEIPKVSGPSEEDQRILKSLSKDVILCGLGGSAVFLEEAKGMFDDLGKVQSEMMTRMFLQFLEEGEESNFDEYSTEAEERLKNAFSGSFKVPAFLVATTPTTPEDGIFLQELVLQNTKEMLAQGETLHEDLTFTKYENDFQGFSFEAPVSNSSVLIKGVFLSGLYQGNLLFYVGPSVDEFRLAESPENALCNAAPTAVWRENSESLKLGFTYFSELFLESMPSLASFSTYHWDAIRKAFGSSDFPLKNSGLIHKTLEELSALQEVNEEEIVTAKAGSLFIKNGLRYESTGGTISATQLKHEPWILGWDETLQPFIRLQYSLDENARVNRAKSFTKMTELALLLLEETREQKGFDLESKLDEALGEVGSFENIFKDLTALYQAWAKDFPEGWGPETCWLIDLKGGMPPAPGIPARVVKEGKTPRFVWAKPVRDRAKIAQGWDTTDRLMRKYVELGSKAAEFPFTIPMAFQNNSEGLTSHFYAIPLTTPDLNPCVVLDESVFMATTSETLSRELAPIFRRAEHPTTQPDRGLFFSLDMAQFANFVADWATLAQSEFPEEVTNPDKAEEFRKTVELLRKADGNISLWSRIKEGKPKTSFHYHFKGLD